MATPTYTLIDSEVLASSASSVEFTSIPQDYRDLVIVMKAAGGTQFWMRINGDTGSNYYHVRMQGNGSTTNSATATESVVEFMQGFSATALLAVGQIMDYSATDKHKTILGRGGVASDGVSAQATRWASTSAITSLTFLNTPGTLVAGTTIYLYGIAS